MAAWEHFPRAPITEALIDIHTTFALPPDLARLETFHSAISGEYPTKQRRVKWQGQIALRPGAVQQAVRQEAEGLMLKSDDGQRVVQARQDGFTFNWLKPYPTWEKFRNEARKHWERFTAMFNPEAVTRLGLRYINRIELPIPFNDFRDFVRTAPDVAPGMPQGLSSLFMRLEIPDEKRGLIAIITETLEHPVGDGKRLPFIFDIDIVRTAPFEPSSDRIWRTFEDMRELKNEIFFNSITERAKEMFR
jgi:uncharacterized protein (TIGR04255 family)